MVGRFGRRRRQDAEGAHPAGPPGLDGPVVVGEAPELAPAPQHRAAAWEAAGKAAGACLVVTGPAGVGKTQFAAALALDLWQDGLDLLIWADGGDPTEVVEVYAETARLLGLPGAPPGNPRAAAEVLPKWLAVTHRRWLLVLDGVGDPADVTPWLPRSHGAAGRVVITTRGEDTAPPADDRLLLRLGPFTEEEATAYLRERLTEAGPGELHEPAAAAELAHALDRSPAALALAAAHLIEERRGLREYLALLRGTGPGPLPGQDEAGRATAAATLLALRAVERADRTGFALPLARFAAHLAPQGHPSELWATTSLSEHLHARTGRRDALVRKLRPVLSPRRIADTRYLLRAYGLVGLDEVPGPREVRTQAAVNAVVRATVPEEESAELVRLAADVLDEAWDVWAGDEDRHPLFRAALRANARTVAEHGGPRLWTPEAHPCLELVGYSLLEDCLPAEAVEESEGHLRRATAYLGERHPQALAARAVLAAAYESAGRAAEALETLRGLPEEQARLHGPDAPEVWAARYALGRICCALERGEEAVRHLTEAAGRATTLFGADHPDTLAARHTLALAHRVSGRPRLAIRLCQEVVTDKERLLGADHPDTLAARHDLALLHHAAGLTGQGVRLIEQVLAHAARVLGPDDTVTLITLASACGLHRAAGDVRRALRYGERSLAGLERVVGPGHPLTAVPRSELAFARHASGEREEALRLREQVLAQYERGLGPDHPDTLTARHELACSHSGEGRHEEALRLHERVLADRGRTLGPAHPDTLLSRCEVAAAHHAAGRVEEAVRLAGPLLADQERLLEADHPDTARTRRLLDTWRTAG
ncbi:tetratricopeptide repeat protein [Streptomyces sp. NPDC005012]|uniref:tetratricopeptide repeat protein n=1 Tax=Streptomyces sp. NPDC005012 TaxID=3154558 RepID=UPI0033ADE0C2